MPPKERIARALTQIKQWMLAHHAPLLVENLDDPATEGQLDEAAAAYGFPLPAELRDLWSLHHGQHEEMNGFIEHLDLLDTRRALGERETVDLFLDLLREDRSDWKVAGVTEEEVLSNRWVAFAGRDSDLIIVSAVSGRVFTCENDSPSLRLLAGSIAEWAEQYAARVLSDDYAVEEGFGDYYLSLRDRAAEQRELERARKREADERHRRETPLLVQLTDALSASDAERCRDVFENVADKAPPEVLAQAVELLFKASSNTKLIATALQVVLHKVELTRERWALVAKGGAGLSNNAIEGIASQRARA